MLKKFFTLFITLITALISYSQPEKKLAEAFIQSVAKNNFKLLDPFITNSKIAKNLFGAEFNKMTPAKQAEAIKKNKISLQSKWARVVNNAKENKIDFSKVQVKQALTGPIEGNNLLSSMLVTYLYNGVEWDDLFFIINKQGAGKYIIDIPSDTRMFALNEDRRGKNLKDIQLAKDINDPNVKQHLKDAVEKLKRLVAANDDQQLYSNMVYKGENDKENRWRRTINPSNPDDVESARRMMEKLKAGFAKCEVINYGDIRIEKESEGVWYVINTTCGGQKHTYAFLKINNVYTLGDTD